MVYEARKQSMAWMETDYSKHTHFRWKIKWRLEHLGALGIMGETAPLRPLPVKGISSNQIKSYLQSLQWRRREQQPRLSSETL